MAKKERLSKLTRLMSMLLARALRLALDFLLPGIAAMETGNSVFWVI